MIDAAELFGIILHIITGNVLGAVVSSVSANSRSLLTGDLQPGGLGGGTDVLSDFRRLPTLSRRTTQLSLRHFESAEHTRLQSPSMGGAERQKE